MSIDISYLKQRAKTLIHGVNTPVTLTRQGDTNFMSKPNNSMPKNNPMGKDKVHKVMGEFKRGKLHSGSGAKVKNRKQAIAIAMSEAGKSKKRK